MAQSREKHTCDAEGHPTHSALEGNGVSVLSTIRDEHLRRARAAAVPPGIRRAIECLETDFANDLSIAELADQAQLSRNHFALTFQSPLSAHRTKITKASFHL